MATSFDGANRRKHERRPANFHAALLVQGARHECTVVDISPGGAKLSLAQSFEPATNGQIDLGQLGEFPVRVCWCRDGATGVQFLMPPREIVDLVIELAKST